NAGIEEFEPFYGMLTNWRTEIINSFTTINGIRINNSFIESKNRILEKLLYNGNGFSNFKRTRNRPRWSIFPWRAVCSLLGPM
ncbi:MAG: transposase, partial [Alphaproteobacteria bacterium]|nr:transposase [Alphaproteobacteria bacterium]